MQYLNDAERIVYTKCQWLCGCFVIFHSVNDDPFVKEKLAEALTKPCPCCVEKVFMPRVAISHGAFNTLFDEALMESNQKSLKKWMQHGSMD